MASLIEDLISTLSKETDLYEKLIPIADNKTKAIVNNDLQSLNEITGREQEICDAISNLEKKRSEVIRNIGVVMNKDPERLNFETIIDLIEGQPKEQEALRFIHDRLKRDLTRLQQINDTNQMLIKQSLDMIEFDMNVIQSTRMSPGAGQYGKSSEMEENGIERRAFDARS
ncbi:MAG: flagellar protein FlgN [Catonella sp.]|jgi:flagellar biosynthesis/type III secretory pathway chaperone|nr:flagellar protein FlgN [Catonella sp.]MDY6355927.1 flagellar protein FlgN [Catonella sp.]